VIPNTILKSKNIAAIGINKIEDPNPETVPIISAMSARIKKSNRLSILQEQVKKKGKLLLPLLQNV
jgi:hypothetical protein